MLNPNHMGAAIKRFFAEAFWFHCAFLFYLLSLIIATLFGEDSSASLRPLGATTLTAICYFGIGARLMGFESEAICRSLLYGLVLGTTVLILYAQFVFVSLDEKLLEGFWQPIHLGVSQLGPSLMKAIVNYSGNQYVSGAGAELSGTARNTLAACLTFLFFTSIPSLVLKIRPRYTYLLAVVSVTLCPAITLLLASRSNLVSFA